jgi:hypothetical protein
VEVVAFIFVPVPFVVVSLPDCVQLETPKVESRAATMKVMLKRRAVQKRRG